jgi:hypothetical protein
MKFDRELAPVARTRVACALLLVAALAACARIKQDPPPPADTPGNYVTLTRPIIAIGDTQEHETTGFPLVANDGAVDAYVEVSQRPPEQPLFGRRIGEWVLVQHADEPLLHLGDVLDMSCRSELERIWNLRKTAKQPIALLPGNHDGLMFGIFNVPLVGSALEQSGHAWYRGCLRGAEHGAADTRRNGLAAAVDRRAFISAYLSSVATFPTPVAGLAPVPEQGDVRISWRDPRPDAFIEAIEASLRDGNAYANSFLAQKLRLPAAKGAPRGVIIIGLDTNQIDEVVGVLDTVRTLSPGDIGHIRSDQFAAVRPWIESARAAGDIVILAGHHNWNRLSFASQLRLTRELSRIDHPLVYLSAHTHQGFWAVHWAGERRVLELNVSSLSDWPIAYRRVSFAYDRAANRIKVMADLMPNAAGTVLSDQALLDSWSALTCGATPISAMRITEEELQAVKQQRQARGTVFNLISEALGDWCDSCKRDLYQSGLRYQDSLLRAIEQTYVDLLPSVPAVRQLRPPESCGAPSVTECLVKLRVAAPDDLDQTQALFSRRAQFIDAMNHQFGELQGALTRNYMACRAVIGAKIDFDLTPKDLRPGMDEDKRRARDFFRIEASIGMQ